MSLEQSYLDHVATFDEVGWGVALIAVTMSFHAFGMLVTLASGEAMLKRLRTAKGFVANVPILIITSWIIIGVHLCEVAVWAAFFVWQDAFPSMTPAYYYALMQYVTVGSELTLPAHWRLLGGLLGMAGLLTFAWSTTVLLALADKFQERQSLLAALLHIDAPRLKAAPDASIVDRARGDGSSSA